MAQIRIEFLVLGLLRFWLFRNAADVAGNRCVTCYLAGFGQVTHGEWRPDRPDPDYAIAAVVGVRSDPVSYTHLTLPTKA